MSFYENVLEFITDKSKAASTRLTIFMLIFSGIILCDNITGFSYYYNKQRQLGQLQSISNLLKDSTLSKKTHEKLVQLEQLTFERKSVLDYSIGFLKNIFNNSGQLNNKKSDRSNFWFLVSSSGIYLLVLILIIPLILFFDKNIPLFTKLGTILMFIIIMFFSSWFFYWLMDKLIPNKLFGNWIWNYIVNFIIQIGLLVGLYWTTKVINGINKNK